MITVFSSRHRLLASPVALSPLLAGGQLESLQNELRELNDRLLPKVLMDGNSRIDLDRGGWRKGEGHWSVTAEGWLKQNTEGLHVPLDIITGDPGWKDYSISVDMMNTSGWAWGFPGVIFHARDISNYEVLFFRPHGPVRDGTFVQGSIMHACGHIVLIGPLYCPGIQYSVKEGEKFKEIQVSPASIPHNTYTSTPDPSSFISDTDSSSPCSFVVFLCTAGST